MNPERRPSRALFRIEPQNGTRCWAVGSPEKGPEQLLQSDWSLDHALSSIGAWSHAIAAAPTGDAPRSARVVAPVESQEVWAAGVTYLRSRDARNEESGGADLYDRVYQAQRPELFFKALPSRVRGPGEAIGVRADSDWNVPEPEIVLVVTADLAVVGLVLGNDVSSRSIEGENALYLPQAKMYDGSCAIGPAIVPLSDVAFPVSIGLSLERSGLVLFEGGTGTDQMARSFDDLAMWAGRALTFPAGFLLFTGTGVVPPSSMTLEPGDVVRITGSGLGELRNHVERVGATG